MSEILIFTPVLHGPHNSVEPLDRLIHCSVHVGVRLTPDTILPRSSATLADFPSMVDWPSGLPDVSLVLGTEAPIKASITGIVPATASTLWKQVFPASTLVRPYAYPVLPDAANDFWFDAAEISSRVQTHYTTASSTYIQPVKTSLLKPRPIPLKFGSVLSKAGTYKTQEFLGAAPPADPILEGAKNFFSGLRPKPAGDKLAPLLPEVPDFHDILGYLHQTPAALRALGLIFEVVAPRPDGMTLASIPSITLSIKFPAAPSLSTSEIWTPTVRFPTPPAVSDGFEDPSGLQALPFDPMHAAHVYSAGPGEELHALRSSGISLMRLPAKGASGDPASANMSRIRSRMDRMNAYSPDNKFDLEVSDLVAGHRIDVWDGKAWRSLCQVTGSASRNGAALPIDAEGILSSSVTVDPGGLAVRANDTLAYWNGWSLCATRPGYVSEPPAASDGPTVGVRVSRSVTPGTLPALRFGKPYIFRARKVDIAGNSLPPGQTAADAYSGNSAAHEIGAFASPAPFLRLEPVGSPALVFAQTPGPGESSTQIVVRTLAAPPAKPILVEESLTRPDPTKPMEAFRTATAVPEHAFHDESPRLVFNQPTPPPAPFSMRYLLPPETTVDMAEKHYVFDSSPGLMSAASFSKIKEGSLWNAGPPATQFPMKADVFAGQIYPDGPPEIPYLPDVACDGAVAIVLDNGDALGIDNGGAKSLSFRTGTEYPGSYKAASLRLVAGTVGAAGSLSIDSRGIEVVLPPGERVTLGLASTIAPEALPQMGLGQWAQAKMTGLTNTNYMDSLQSGLVPTVTPHRQIRLIHAVQQPLSAPVVASGEFQQQAQNDTIAKISYGLSYDAKSTATVTIEAVWTEWIDHGTGTGTPGSRAMTAHLATLVAPPTDAEAPVQPLSSSYVFGDTKARGSLTISAIAASSFAEFFEAGTDCTLRSAASVSVPRPATAPPSPPRLAYAIPSFKWNRTLAAETGPYTSVRSGNALRVYLERPWFTSGDGELLAVIIGNALQSSTAIHSQWGADPLAAAAPPAGNSSTFLFQSEGNLHPQASDSFPGATESVVFVPFDVEYDALTDRYFADVTFDEATFGGAYRPFVQLEVAAYQPNSIAGCRLSTSITVPFTQIFPDRTFTVSLVPAPNPLWPPTVETALQGIGPQAPTPGVYTSDLGRGIGIQRFAEFVFSDIYVYPQFGGDKTIEHKSEDTGGGNEGGSGDGAKKAFGATKMPDGKLTFSPAGSTQTLNTQVGSPNPGWGSVVITANEWELLSADQLLLEAVRTGIASGSLPGGIPDSSSYSEYAFVDPFPRPCRLVYTETVTLQSGWSPPAAALQPLPSDIKK